MQKRVMGKASFCNILDLSGNNNKYPSSKIVGLNINVEEIADEVHLNAQYLMRLFRKEYFEIVIFK